MPRGVSRVRVRVRVRGRARVRVRVGVDEEYRLHASRGELLTRASAVQHLSG